MFDRNGVATPEMVREVFPSMERIRKGPVAVIECYREIPCNPCATSCKIHAIKPFEDINDLPDIDHDACTGCSLCVSACPGLAIMVVDGSKSEDMVIFRIPYEFRPLPEEGEVVEGLDRAGASLGPVRILKVQNLPYQDKTPILHVEVPIEHLYAFRNIKVVR